MKNDLSRFITAHRSDYDRALFEIRNGKKKTHWMWYIFPQLKGLGHSQTSDYYGIRDQQEAKAFLEDAFLGGHLREISSALLELSGNDATELMGRPDDLKLRSSMTLFAVAAPGEKVFEKVLIKYFGGKRDPRTLRRLGLLEPEEDGKAENSIFSIEDGNIRKLRSRYPDGLHFVVGDTHGAYTTLFRLMEKILFDPRRDHAFFVGDYNAGGDVGALLRYMARYYQADCSIPGFHMIRGNHERELYPLYELENLPDVILVRGRVLNYYIAHAGMVKEALLLIHEDAEKEPEKKTLAYALQNSAAGYDAPLRQVIWSRNGLYAPGRYNRFWPSRDDLFRARACVIHGHTPFSMLKKGNQLFYGGEALFWDRQKILFSEDLQSFDIDSNVKGRMNGDDPSRRLSCICLEVLDEIAEAEGGVLTMEGVRRSENFVFSVPHTMNDDATPFGDLARISDAKPERKVIGRNEKGSIQIL